MAGNAQEEKDALEGDLLALFRANAAAGRRWSNNVALVAHITVNVVPNVSLPDVQAILDAAQDWPSR